MTKSLAIISVLAAAGAAFGNTFVVPHIIERSGSIVDVGYDATGGVVLRGIDRQHHFINLRKVLEPGSPLLQSAVACLTKGSLPPDQLTLHRLDRGGGGGGGGGAGGSIDFSTSLITEIGFPAMDGSSKDPAFLSIQFDADAVKFSGFSPPTKDEKNAVLADQKKWLPANFRLKLDGLPTDRINKVDSFTIKQAADLDGDGIPDLVCSDITFYVDLADASSYAQWFRDSQSGLATGRRMAFDCVTSDGSADIQVTGVAEPTSVGFADVFLGDLFSNPANPGPALVTIHVSSCGMNAPNI